MGGIEIEEDRSACVWEHERAAVRREGRPSVPFAAPWNRVADNSPRAQVDEPEPSVLLLLCHEVPAVGAEHDRRDDSGTYVNGIADRAKGRAVDELHRTLE